MDKPFKAPEPMSGERHDDYLRRLVLAFEDWANGSNGAERQPAKYVGTIPNGSTLHRVVFGADGMLDVEASIAAPVTASVAIKEL